MGREPNTQHADIKRLFRGSLDSWLPLFRRLLARLVVVPRVDTVASRGSFAIKRSDPTEKTVGSIHVKKDGLLIGLSLPKGAISRTPRLEVLSKRRRDGATHTILITKASDIDTELLNWIKAARPKARTSKRRST